MRTCAIFESLETRRLLDAVIDLRLPGGGKSINVTSVGQTVTMEAWVTVSGKNPALQGVSGSFLSTNDGGGAALGDMKATPDAPFNASGSTAAAQADLDDDGDLDAGSNNPAVATGFFFTRTATAGGETTGTPGPNGAVQFKVGTVTFKVTQLLGGSKTNLNFRARNNSSGALWFENTIAKNPTSGTFKIGAPVVVTSDGGSTTGSIAGVAFLDVNKNGSHDSGDTALKGWKVFIDKDNDGQPDSTEPSDVTDDGGHYSFDNLAGGTYHLVEVVPKGYRAIDGASKQVTLLSGQDRTLNLANLKAGTIAGVVFADADGDGSRDSGDDAVVSAKVFLDANNNSTLDSGERSTLTNGEGAYSFDDLNDGEYHVRVQLKAAQASTPTSYLLTVSKGTQFSGKNFGIAELDNSIAGMIYEDADADGKHDSGEAGLSGWTVFLDADKDNHLDTNEAHTLTDSTGAFHFDNVAPGSWRIVEMRKPGYRSTNPSSGTLDVTLAPKQNLAGLLFGNTRLAQVSGVVFDDDNDSGTRETGEDGMSGWRVWDDVNNNGKLDSGEANVLTDAKGNYTLNLSPTGNHYIRVVQRSGYTRTSPLLYKLEPGPGSVTTNKMFGERAV